MWPRSSGQKEKRGSVFVLDGPERVRGKRVCTRPRGFHGIFNFTLCAIVVRARRPRARATRRAAVMAVAVSQRDGTKRRGAIDDASTSYACERAERQTYGPSPPSTYVNAAGLNWHSGAPLHLHLCAQTRGLGCVNPPLHTLCYFKIRQLRLVDNETRCCAIQRFGQE